MTSFKSHICPACAKPVAASEADEHGQHLECTAWWGAPSLRQQVWHWFMSPEGKASIEGVLKKAGTLAPFGR